MSSTPRATVAAQTLIAALALAACARSACASLNCGPMPALQPASVAQAIQSEAQETAERIRQHPAGDRRHFAVSQRKDLREKYPQVDPLLLDSVLLWTTCQDIEDDKQLALPQAFDEYSGLYRLLSEPIKAPANAE